VRALLAAEDDDPAVPDLDTDQRFALGATYITDAVHCYPLTHRTDPLGLRVFRALHALQYAMLALLAVYLALTYFEHPAPPALRAAYLGTEVVEFFILMACVAWMVLRFYVYGRGGLGMYLAEDTWWRFLEPVVILCNLIDLFGSIAVRDATRWSRPLRIFYLMNFNDATRDQAFLVAKTIMVLALPLLTLLGWISAFALYFLIVLHSNTDPAGTPPGYFNDYYQSWSAIYVTLTTANYPDVLVPAFNASRWHSMAFMLYLGLGMYLGLNLLLGLVYSAYRTEVESEASRDAKHTERALGLAFDELRDVDLNAITRRRFLQLFKVFRAQMPTEAGIAAFARIDKDSSGTITREEFLALASTLFLEYRKPKARVAPSHPRVWAVVHSPLWKTAMLVSAVLGSAASAWSITRGRTVFAPMWPFWIDLLALVVVVLNLVLKRYALGARKLLFSVWGLIDCSIVAVSILAKVVVEIGFGSVSYADPVTAIRVLRIALVLRLVKLLALITTFAGLRQLCSTLARLAPTLAKFSAIIMLAFYAFASLGIWVFRGALVPGNPALAGSAFESANYFALLNFETFDAALQTLYMLLVLNNHFVVLEACVAATSRWALLYFLTYYLVMNIVIINLVVSSILDQVVFLIEKTRTEEDAKMREIQRLLKGSAKKGSAKKGSAKRGDRGDDVGGKSSGKGAEGKPDPPPPKEGDRAHQAASAPLAGGITWPTSSSSKGKSRNRSRSRSRSSSEESW
jgi:hypothetical protein